MTPHVSISPGIALESDTDSEISDAGSYHTAADPSDDKDDGPPDGEPTPKSPQTKQNEIIDRMRVAPFIAVSRALLPNGYEVFVGNTASIRLDSLGSGVTSEVSFMKLPPELKRQLGMETKKDVFGAPKRASNPTGLDSPGPGSASARHQALFREVRILAHESIRNHSNIVRLYAVYFEPEETCWGLSRPVAVLEYAEYGTLAELEVTAKTNFGVLGEILGGVVSAVRHLHSCFIAHQDIKPGNILLCKEEGKNFVPKLADFGYAVFGKGRDHVVAHGEIGGSKPWNAPNVYISDMDKVDLDVAMSNDVYSLALVALSIAITRKDDLNPDTNVKNKDGDNEGDEGDDHDDDDDDDDDDDEEDDDDDDGALVKCDTFWVEQLKRRWSQQTSTAEQDLEKRKGTQEFQDDLIQLLRDTRHPQAPFEIIAEAFRQSIMPDPRQRNQEAALAQLAAVGPQVEESVALESSPIPDMTLRQLYGPDTPINSYRFCVQHEFVQELELVAHLTGNDPDLRDDCYGDFLARLLLTGYGRMSEEDRIKRAYKSLTSNRTTSLASEHLRRAIGLPETEGASCQENLEYLVREGDIVAWTEMRSSQLGLLKYLNKNLKSLNVKGDESLDTIPSCPDDLRAIGDAVDPGELHYYIYEAARTGRTDLVIAGLDAFSEKVNVNFQFGSHRTTLLLAAARAGNRELCSELIKRKADPLIAGAHGDIPLHWLARFEPDLKGDVAKLAKIAKAFMERPMPGKHAPPLQWWAHFPQDKLLRGTPLHFAIAHCNGPAVEALLAVGAQPFIRIRTITGLSYDDEDGIYQAPSGERSTWTPFCLAVRLNADKCLRVIVEKYYSCPEWKSFFDGLRGSPCHCFGGAVDLSHQLKEPYLVEALRSRYIVQRMRIHGGRYKEAMIATVDILHSVGIRLHAVTPSFGPKLDGSQRPSEDKKVNLFTLATHWRYPWLLQHVMSDEGRFPCLVPRINTEMYLATEKPLWQAIYRGDLPMFEVLYPHSGKAVLDVWDGEQGWPLLHLCAAAGHQNIDLARAMLDKGPDLNRRDKLGRTALEVTILDNFTEMADLLILRGANLDAEHKGMTSFCRFLLQPVLPRHCIDYFLGLHRDNCQTVPNLPKPDCWSTWDRNVFHALACADRQPWFRGRVIHIFDDLVGQSSVYGSPEQLNKVDRLGMTPLMLAVFHGHVLLVARFLRHGASAHGVKDTVTNAITIADTMRAATLRMAKAYGGERRGRRARRALRDWERICRLLKKHGGKAEYTFFGLPKMNVLPMIKGFHPQDAPQYVELVFRAAKRANSQPGTEEYRTKQAFDFYMAMMNPPELSLLMKGSARYVFFGEVDPFIDAVEPLFENTIIPMKYVRTTAEAAAGKCPYATVPTATSSPGPPQETKMDLGTLDAIIKGVGPNLLKILAMAPMPGGLQWMVIKWVVVMVVQFAIGQATKGKISRDHLPRIKGIVKKALPAIPTSISSEIEKVVDRFAR